MDLAKEFDSEYLEGWMLFNKKDTTLTIAGASKGHLPNFRTGKQDEKILMHFEESPKTLPLNKTNLKSLVMLMGGTDTDQWLGRRIAVFAEHVKVAGQMRLGVRIRDIEPPPRKLTRRETKEANGTPPVPDPPMPESQAVQAALSEDDQWALERDGAYSS